MARGDTLGRRRKRRRRERTASPPYPDHSLKPRRLSDEEELARAMTHRPAWVKAVWATPERRLLLSVGFLAAGAWILVSAFSDPDTFFARGRSTLGFLAAPLLVLMFGLQAIEAVADLVRKRDSLPVFHRLGWWLDKRGIGFVFVYLVVMIALLVKLID
jgi:hypothetical protein